RGDGFGLSAADRPLFFELLIIGFQGPSALGGVEGRSPRPAAPTPPPESTPRQSRQSGPASPPALAAAGRSTTCHRWPAGHRRRRGGAESGRGSPPRPRRGRP